MPEKIKYAKPALLCRPVSEPPVPRYWTGCSNCGCVWDMFYVTIGFDGPPNYCPKCGAMNVSAERRGDG